MNRVTKLREFHFFTILRESFDRYFFATTTFNAAACLRFVVIGLMLIPRIGRDLYNFSLNCQIESVFRSPNMATDWLPFSISVFSEHLILMKVICYCLALACFFGIATRISLLILGGITFFVMSFNNSFGSFNHVTSLIGTLCLLLPFLPGVTAFSLDRLIFSKPCDFSSKEDVWKLLRGDHVPVWGTKLLLAMLASIYFAAGYAKLKYAGLDFANGSILQFYLSGKATCTTQIFGGASGIADNWRDGIGLTHYFYCTPSSTLGIQLSQFPAIMTIMALFTMFFEIFSPLILVNSFFRNTFLIWAILFHVGSQYLMDVRFGSYSLLCLALIDWPPIIRLTRASFTFRRPLRGREEAQASGQQAQTFNK